MVLIPAFQPQNPAINGYYLGWASCTAYSAAMAASFHKQVKLAITGERVRRLTGDTSGGLTLAQVDAALNNGIGVNLSTYYRLPWSTFSKYIDAGMGAILQGLYAPIADSPYDAGRGFRGNHAVFVPPGWGVMDPLADGRAAGVHKYNGVPYSRSLMRSFAGRLDLDPGGAYRPLGDGYVYAAFTKDNVHSYRVHYGGRFWVYRLDQDGRIASRTAREFSDFSSSSCTAPRLYSWPGHTSRTLVRVTNARSSLYGQYLAIPQSNVHVETIP